MRISPLIIQSGFMSLVNGNNLCPKDLRKDWKAIRERYIQKEDVLQLVYHARDGPCVDFADWSYQDMPAAKPRRRLCSRWQGFRVGRGSRAAQTSLLPRCGKLISGSCSLLEQEVSRSKQAQGLGGLRKQTQTKTSNRRKFKNQYRVKF